MSAKTGLGVLASQAGGTPDVSSWAWATVTAIGPLRVQLDGEDSALDVTPDSLVTGLAVDDRVWVQLVTNPNPTRRYRRLVVLGRAGCPFPIGHVYVSTDSTDPGDLFGGAWTQIEDRFLLAAGSTYTAGATGGEATHTLTVAEMPAHAHTLTNGGADFPTSGFSGTNYAVAGGGTFGFKGGNVASNGGGGAHNNMPPYLAVYVWERTA